MLYLHEIIDIIADGQQAYMDSVVERAGHSAAQGISRLVGTWKVIGSTHHWPRVVNLWEMDGWEHWALALERQFVPAQVDASLAPWWKAATQWRSGGFDRILEPAAYSPTLRELQAQGLRAWVCVQTIVQAAPGRRADYVRAVGRRLRPLLAARGVTLMGAYTTPMRSDEVLLLWAAPDFRALCALHGARRQDAGLREWGRQIAGLRRAFEMCWLVPSTACFFHPQQV